MRENRKEKDMDTTVKESKTGIKNGVKCAFIFMLMTLGVSQIFIMILPFLPSQICEILGMLLGTVLALCGKCKPEKGTLTAVHNKMTGTCFLVVLGAFLLAKLLSLGAAAVLVTLLVNDSNAAALSDIAGKGENLLLSFLFMGVFTPLCEEAVFRGCIGSNYRKHGIWFAMLMSTLLFSLYHCNLFQLFSTFLPGIVLFYVAMNYSIKWSVVLHFINNGVLSIGSSALQKLYPDSFFAGYGEYIIEAVLVIAALLLMKKEHAIEKVRAFLSGPENEKGAYRSATGNIWFILIVLAVAVVSALMLFIVSGNLPELPAIS